jgi:hypothetical protein
MFNKISFFPFSDCFDFFFERVGTCNDGKLMLKKSIVLPYPLCLLNP